MKKPAKRHHAKLGIDRETVRVLGNLDLIGARGGDDAQQYDTGAADCTLVRR